MDPRAVDHLLWKRRFATLALIVVPLCGCSWEESRESTRRLVATRTDRLFKHVDPRFRDTNKDRRIEAFGGARKEELICRVAPGKCDEGYGPHLKAKKTCHAADGDCDGAITETEAYLYYYGKRQKTPDEHDAYLEYELRSAGDPDQRKKLLDEITIVHLEPRSRDTLVRFLAVAMHQGIRSRDRWLVQYVYSFVVERTSLIDKKKLTGGGYPICVELALKLKLGPRAIPMLVELMAEEGTAAHRAAKVALLGSSKKSSAIPALTTALKNRHWLLRETAAKALGEIKDRAVVAPLISALKDDYACVRLAAAESLGKIGDRSAVEALTEALNDRDGDSRVSEAAAAALKKIKRINYTGNAESGD